MHQPIKSFFYSGKVEHESGCVVQGVVKAKFHYAIWFEPASNQLRTSSEQRDGIWLLEKKPERFARLSGSSKSAGQFRSRISDDNKCSVPPR